MPGFINKRLEQEISLTGSLSMEEVKRRWLEYGKECEKTIGKPLCEYRVGNEFIVFYHSSYKKDFCDTMFSGEILKNDESCQLHGFIKVTPLMKRFALILLIFCVLLGALYLVYAPFGYPFIGLIIAALGFAVAFLSVRVDKARINTVLDSLQDFINGK